MAVWGSSCTGGRVDTRRAYRPKLGLNVCVLNLGRLVDTRRARSRLKLEN